MYAEFPIQLEVPLVHGQEDRICTSRNTFCASTKSAFYEFKFYFVFLFPFCLPPSLPPFFSSTGSVLTSSGNTPGSNSGSSRERDREREREAMDPIAELLSQLSGVRRGLSGVSGASGLGSVLGLGALGSLGGALGSLGGMPHSQNFLQSEYGITDWNFFFSVTIPANLSGPSPGSSNSGLPASSGRGTGRLLEGLMERRNTGLSI